MHVTLNGDHHYRAVASLARGDGGSLFIFFDSMVQQWRQPRQKDSSPDIGDRNTRRSNGFLVCL